MNMIQVSSSRMNSVGFGNNTMFVRFKNGAVYAYMNKIYSSRDIENACRRNINFMFLLEGASAPVHSTIARFRSVHFAPCAERILAETDDAMKNGQLKPTNYEVSKKGILKMISVR